MDKIGQEQGNEIVGIAWDDEYSPKNTQHILVRLSERLEPWKIAFEATRDENAFRKWLSEKSYQFVFLDILKQYPQKPTGPEWTGLKLIKELRESTHRPGVPVIVLTSAEEHLRHQSYEFRPNEYLKSKWLNIDWLSTEIIEILELQAVRIDREKVAVFDDTADGRFAQPLVKALQQGFPRTFVFEQFPTASLDTQAAWERLRQCLGVVAVRANPPGGGDGKRGEDFLLRLGMVLSQPRAWERCIQIERDAVGFSPEGVATEGLVEQLRQRLEDLRQPPGRA